MIINANTLGGFLAGYLLGIGVLIILIFCMISYWITKRRLKGKVIKKIERKGVKNARE